MASRVLATLEETTAARAIEIDIFIMRDILTLDTKLVPYFWNLMAIIPMNFKRIRAPEMYEL